MHRRSLILTPVPLPSRLAVVSLMSLVAVSGCGTTDASSGTGASSAHLAGTAVKVGAAIDGYTVGGKTGTAQSGPNTPDHGWFIGFALDKNGTPVSAVCVELEQAGSGGSAEAARIAGRIMAAAIAEGR